MEQEDAPPRSFPLKSLEELRSRSYFESPHFALNKSSVPLQNATSRLKRPRLLACHDLQGGYVDDQWVQGSTNAKAYTLTQWRLLDSFVYFSHNLVTLPPPGWTNAAHLHGVQVLGTFITEWEAGADVCRELLQSDESARMYANCLAELAAALGFDGWLINIENVVPADLCCNLRNFVAYLTASMHALVPESLVIWYDAVTIQGKLRWQDQLNSLNKSFFDVCDGIFVNYTWKKDYAKQSASASVDRPFDVYMGVDVFGRNTYGGGGYQCDVALNAVREAGVSAALFAPGWAYETNQDEKRWWDTIDNCWPAARPDPIRVPFFTDFDIGHGRAKCLDGKEVSDLSWNNLACQNLQPLLHVSESAPPLLRISRSLEPPVYAGGVSISASGHLSSDELYIFQLYHTDVTIHETFLGVSYSIIAESGSKFCLALSVQDSNGAKALYFLLDSEKADSVDDPQNHQFKHMSAIFVYPEGTGTNGTSSEDLSENEVMQVGSVHINKRPQTWSRRNFLLDWGEQSLIDIFGVCTQASDFQPFLISQLHRNETLFSGEAFVAQNCAKQSDAAQETLRGPSSSYFAKLGHISIASGSHEHFRSSDMRLMGSRFLWSIGDGGKWFLSLNLDWKLPSDDQESLDGISLRYYLYAAEGEAAELLRLAPTYLGMTMRGTFNVYMLPVSKRASAVTFKLDVQCLCGKINPCTSGITYTLQVPSPDSGHYVRTQPSLDDWLFKNLK